MDKLTMIYRTGYIHLSAYQSELSTRIATLKAFIEHNKINLALEELDHINTSLELMYDDINKTDDAILELL